MFKCSEIFILQQCFISLNTHLVMKLVLFKTCIYTYMIYLKYFLVSYIYVFLHFYFINIFSIVTYLIVLPFILLELHQKLFLSARCLYLYICLITLIRICLEEILDHHF